MNRTSIHLILLSLLLTPLILFAQQETPPPPAAPRPINVPKPIEKSLKNGLRVIVIEDKDVPLVSAQVMIRNGGEVDPPQLSGAADMTASVLTKGTKTRTAPEIAQAIEALGGALTSNAGWDSSRLTVNVMSSKIEPAMTILADVIRNSTFKDDEIERLRQQYLDVLSVTLRDPGSLAPLVAARVVFGDAAYGHPVNGTPESIARIKREDILQLHSKYYRPDNAVLIIGGDIKADNAFTLAERAFGDWTKPETALSATQVQGSKDEKNKDEEKQRIVVIDMPDAGQAAVVLARRGIRRIDPNYFPGIVANSILGGGFSSRLSQEIRIKRGLSYGAQSKLDVRRDVGQFFAIAQTKNESGPEVASLLISELARLASDPVPEAEMTPRKAVLIGSFGRALETTDSLVTQVGSLALFGLSLDEINNFVKNVQSVAASDVQRFAGMHLNKSSANIIIVGNAKLFLDELRKQFAAVEVIPIAELDLNNASLHKSNATGAKD